MKILMALMILFMLQSQIYGITLNGWIRSKKKSSDIVTTENPISVIIYPELTTNDPGRSFQETAMSGVEYSETVSRKVTQGQQVYTDDKWTQKYQIEASENNNVTPGIVEGTFKSKTEISGLKNRSPNTQTATSNFGSYTNDPRINIGDRESESYVTGYQENSTPDHKMITEEPLKDTSDSPYITSDQYSDSSELQNTTPTPGSNISDSQDRSPDLSYESSNTKIITPDPENDLSVENTAQPHTTTSEPDIATTGLGTDRADIEVTTSNGGFSMNSFDSRAHNYKSTKLDQKRETSKSLTLTKRTTEALLQSKENTRQTISLDGKTIKRINSYSRKVDSTKSLDQKMRSSQHFTTEVRTSPNQSLDVFTNGRVHNSVTSPTSTTIKVTTDGSLPTEQFGNRLSPKIVEIFMVEAKPPLTSIKPFHPTTIKKMPIMMAQGTDENKYPNKKESLKETNISDPQSRSPDLRNESSNPIIITPDTKNDRSAGNRAEPHSTTHKPEIVTTYFGTDRDDIEVTTSKGSFSMNSFDSRAHNYKSTKPYPKSETSKHVTLTTMYLRKDPQGRNIIAKRTTEALLQSNENTRQTISLDGKTIKRINSYFRKVDSTKSLDQKMRSSQHFITYVTTSPNQSLDVFTNGRVHNSVKSPTSTTIKVTTSGSLPTELFGNILYPKIVEIFMVDAKPLLTSIKPFYPTTVKKMPIMITQGIDENNYSNKKVTKRRIETNLPSKAASDPNSSINGLLSSSMAPYRRNSNMRGESNDVRKSTHPLRVQEIRNVVTRSPEIQSTTLGKVNPISRSVTRWIRRDASMFSASFDPTCTLDKDNGKGSEAFSRWYYNELSRSCEWFKYYGKGGNGNRFNNRANCENSCVEQHTDLCARPDIVNCEEMWLSCRMEYDRSCHDEAKRKGLITVLFCTPLQPLCVSKNGKFRKPPIYPTHRNMIPIECKEVKDPGYCDMNSNSVLVFYYDINYNDCHGFLYSKCGGNSNRFSSKKECMNHCAY